MKIIEKISDMITEEIGDAEKYVRCALKYKDDMPDLAEVFYKLSTEELTHMLLLHEQVARIIADYKRKNGDVPERMQAVYDYLHEKQIEHTGQVKAMQALYRS